MIALVFIQRSVFVLMKYALADPIPLPTFNDKCTRPYKVKHCGSLPPNICSLEQICFWHNHLDSILHLDMLDLGIFTCFCLQL